MSNVYIVGTGDLAREILYAIREQNKGAGETHEVQGFLDPVQSGKKELEGLPVLRIDTLDRALAESAQYIVGIGTPSYMRKADAMLTARGMRHWVNVVHPRAYLAPGVQLGKGVYVAAHASIAIAARICDFSVINQNASIGHDAIIGQYTVVSPGCIVSGRCELGQGVFLGSGAIVFPGVKLGSDSLISANCVVTQNVPDRVKVMPVSRNLEIPLQGIP